MKITNKLNLPEVFEKIVSSNPPKEHRYSVTELLNPTKEIKLTRKYWDEIELDVSDCVNMLFGSAVHKVFEENSTYEESEVKYEVQFGEDTVVGIADVVKDDEITDYKTATTSKKDYKDYEDQILAYSLLRLKKTGYITRKGKAIVLFKDWSKIKAASGGNYPQSPIYVHKFNINDSDYDYIEKKIIDKLKELNQKEIPECTDGERWYTGTKYAVYKNIGDKRAIAVYDTEQEAHDCITNKCDGAGQIEIRKGEYLKCKHYCNCLKFCKMEDEK